jgi:uncharacterized protein YgbK (DUF1537 family)
MAHILQIKNYKLKKSVDSRLRGNYNVEKK